jgi:hypothetical protein
MHDHWKSIISSRTSSKEVVAAMVSQFGNMRELQDDHDFEQQISECIQYVTDWFSTASRAGLPLSDNPFHSCANILDFIAVGSNEKKRWPQKFIPAFAEGDEETIYEVAGVGKVSRLVTPEAITRDIVHRKVNFARYIHAVSKLSTTGASEYWAARTPDGELVAIGETLRGVVLGAIFTTSENRMAAEDIVTAYIVDKQLPMITATSVSGLVFSENGAFYRLNEMPAGLTIRGDVEITAKHADNWPEGITVEGSLRFLSEPSNMRVTPARLHVAGDLVWVGGNIESLGDGLIVGGNTRLHCENLTKVGAGCCFGGDLWLENEAILDQNFTVAGKVFTGDIKTRRQLEYPRRSLVKRLLRMK